MRKTFECIVVLSFLLLAAVPSFAQTFGQITGIVTDTTGGVLVGATVTVANTQTGATATQQANSAGLYVFPNLLPGVYNVKVEMDGFRGATRNRVEVQIQQTVRLDFKLEIGSLNETVVVTSSPVGTELQTANATVGTTISLKELELLPNLGRDASTLMALQPGVRRPVKWRARSVTKTHLRSMAAKTPTTCQETLSDTSLTSLELPAVRRTVWHPAWYRLRSKV